MKNTYLLIVIVTIFISCNQKEKPIQVERTGEKLKNEAISLAKNYVTEQLTAPEINIDSKGIITVNDEERRYEIDPKETFTGLIDKDTIQDAIVTLTSFYMNESGLNEQLIFININGQLTLMKALEADMKILMLKDRIITAELHTKPRNSPLYNCAACKEIVDYTYEDGELVKIE